MTTLERPKSTSDLQKIYADLAPKMDRMAWLNRLVTGRLDLRAAGWPMKGRTVRSRIHSPRSRTRRYP